MVFAPVVKCFNRVVGQTLLVRAYGKKSELIIDRLAELTVNCKTSPNYNKLEFHNFE